MRRSQQRASWAKLYGPLGFLSKEEMERSADKVTPSTPVNMSVMVLITVFSLFMMFMGWGLLAKLLESIR